MKKTTPLETLRHKQNKLKNTYKKEQKLLTTDWQYLHEHSGSLLISGISYLFYPRRHKTPTTSTKKENPWQNIQDNLPFYLAIARESLSIIWYISRPFYFRRNRNNK